MKLERWSLSYLNGNTDTLSTYFADRKRITSYLRFLVANLDISKIMSIFATTKQKYGMNNDLSERISQGFYREKIKSDKRNAEVADWLFRSCQTGTPEFDRGKLLVSKRGLISRESIIAEDYAVVRNLWFEDASLLGMLGPCGDENYGYVSPDGSTIYKVNILSHSCDRILPIFNKILIHNELFPETRYDFVGKKSNL